MLQTQPVFIAFYLRAGPRTVLSPAARQTHQGSCRCRAQAHSRGSDSSGLQWGPAWVYFKRSLTYIFLQLYYCSIGALINLAVSLCSAMLLMPEMPSFSLSMNLNIPHFPKA